MKRKVAQIGPSTLMVSLPSQWVKANNIKKGEELDVNLSRKEICFSLGNKKEEEKEITLDISNFNKYLLSRYLEVLYISNYHKIILHYSSGELHNDKNQTDVNVKSVIKKLSERFIGMEIVSQTKNMTELRCFLLDQEKDLNKIEKRIYFLLNDFINEFFHALEGNYQEFHQNVYNYHDTIYKFTSYYLRVLDHSEKSFEEKKQLYSLHLIIDKMVDKLRHLSEAIVKYKCTPKVKKTLKEIFSIVNEQFLALHKGELSRKLITDRYVLVKKIEEENYSLNELRVITEVKLFLDTINDFTRAVIVKGLAQKN